MKPPKPFWQRLDLHDARVRHWAILICLGLLAVLAVLARKSLLDAQNPDYQVFSSWYDYVNRHGIHSFKYGFSNYNPPYTYFLYISTLLPISKIIAIKGVMALFDILLAMSVYYVVKIFRPQNYVPYIAALVTLFVPTVLLTGAFWGQFDNLYTAFILFSLAAGLKNNSRWAWIFFGVAIAVKFQAIFFLPVLGIMCFKRIKWYDGVWAGGSFLLLTLPPMLAGRSLGSLLDIYPAQARLFNGQLVLNVPNLYQWIPNTDFRFFNDMGIMLGVALAVTVLLISLIYRKFSDKDLLLVTSLLLLAIPFVLPAMHERYVFPASIALIPLAFVYARLAWAAIAVQVTIIFSYCPFLFSTMPIDMRILTLVNLAVIYALFAEFLKPSDPAADGPKSKRRVAAASAAL